MRKTLNENPIVQIAVLGVLAVIVGFLLLGKVMHKSEGAGTSPTPSPAAGAATPGATTTPSPTPPASESSGEASGEASVPPASPEGGAPADDFVAGPGLPAPVVKGYEDGKAVVLLVVRHRGIDDAALRQSVERLRGRGDLAVFVTRARHIARYARITQGVNVSRVPALVVIRPRHHTHGPPTASVSYGFRGADSVQQAIRNALYKGPTDLPYYP